MNWNPDDPLALLRVINELIEEYRNYQKGLLLGDNSMLNYMYTSLLENNKYREEDIEILVLKKCQVIHFSVYWTSHLVVFTKVKEYFLVPCVDHGKQVVL